MYLVRCCLIKPLVERVFLNLNVKMSLQMSELNFFLLCISTILIAAAGYSINDYFDIRIDRINKPHKIIVGRHIKRRVAMGLHIILNIIGILLGAWVSYSSGLWKLIGIQFFAVISLWLYSTNFKRRLIIGNVVVAFLASLVILLPGLYEIPMIEIKYNLLLNTYNANLNFLIGYILFYALFAFLMTFAREITKDVIDKKGDEITGCNTIPIFWGSKIANWFITVTYIIILLLVFYVWEHFLIGEKTYFGDLIRFDLATFLYLLIFVFIPLIWLIYKSITTSSIKDYIIGAKINKAVSLAGALYMITAYYTFMKGIIL